MHCSAYAAQPGHKHGDGVKAPLPRRFHQVPRRQRAFHRVEVQRRTVVVDDAVADLQITAGRFRADFAKADAAPLEAQFLHGVPSRVPVVRCPVRGRAICDDVRIRVEPVVGLLPERRVVRIRYDAVLAAAAQVDAGPGDGCR